MNFYNITTPDTEPGLSLSSTCLGAMSILRKVFEDLEMISEYRKWLFIAGRFNWLTISIWTKENLCPSIGMMMPCQLELKPEWDVQSMSDQTDLSDFNLDDLKFYKVSYLTKRVKTSWTYSIVESIELYKLIISSSLVQRFDDYHGWKKDWHGTCGMIIHTTNKKLIL